ncbi:hypothetical protein Pan216_41880 [Planctomycetes bacterium Pan216]|uniref:Uncharacterized protein n=1 Tax=Kolteria novifilia TaxID=2527975 RepID=A0A518B8L6_9BACT|nr:hypothetical protein Pan216_41880 [Planctomycetes bacterium Pan216]
MFDELEQKLAKLRQALAEAADHLEESRPELSAGDGSLFENLRSQLREVFATHLPEIEKRADESRTMHADARRMHEEGVRRYKELEQALAKHREARTAHEHPILSDIDSWQQRLREAVAELEESGAIWWTVVSLCALEAGDVITFDRETEIATAMAALWVAAPDQTERTALGSTLIGDVRSATAKLLLCSLVVSHRKMRRLSQRSPHSLAAQVVSNAIRKGLGPTHLSNYQSAVDLAVMMGQGELALDDHTKPKLPERGYANWISEESSTARLDAAPSIGLVLTPTSRVHPWPLVQVEEVLARCVETVCRISASSTEPIDRLASRFLGQCGKSPADVPATPGSLRDWVYDSGSALERPNDGGTPSSLVSPPATDDSVTDRELTATDMAEPRRSNSLEGWVFPNRDSRNDASGFPSRNEESRAGGDGNKVVNVPFRETGDSDQSSEGDDPLRSSQWLAASDFSDFLGPKSVTGDATPGSTLPADTERERRQRFEDYVKESLADSGELRPEQIDGPSETDNDDRS